MRETRSDGRRGREERERSDAKGDEGRAKCERREEREAGEGRRQRGEEKRAASRHGEELCATAARRKKERMGNGRVNSLLKGVLI